MAEQTFSRLVRFHPESDPTKILIGQPVDEKLDVGLAAYDGKPVEVKVFSGTSVLSPGQDSGSTDHVKQLLSPLDASEVGTIRCIGLNYKQHAEEAKMEVPSEPVVFMKPATALAGPSPSAIPLPRLTQESDTGDYESELCVVIGKAAKNVSEAQAMEYVLGYTASNDVSCRSKQFSQSQWGFSKSFDGACPIGPALVSKALIPDPSKLRIRGLHNGQVAQESGIDDLIFSIPKLVAFLSQSTTLPPGTIILTGTPAGVGAMRKPKVSLKHGDEFKVEVLPHIGTLVNKFENE